MGVWLFFFFFKQKTAYGLRISDWSSDVCSSDLNSRPGVPCACEKCSNMRSRPMQDMAYSPGGSGGIASVEPWLATGTKGYTQPVEKATMREARKLSATSAGTWQIGRAHV